MKNLKQEEWQEGILNDPNAEILDVRTEDECNEGIIPGARMLDIYQPEKFMEGVDALDKSKHYYVYCKAGARSLQACHILDQAGIAETFNLEGGFMQWKGERETP